MLYRLNPSTIVNLRFLVTIEKVSTNHFTLTFINDIVTDVPLFVVQDIISVIGQPINI